MTGPEVVAAVRFVAWSLEFACSLVVAHYVVSLIRWPDYRLGNRTRVRVSVGLGIKCCGWGLHQLYWWAWQMAMLRGRQDLKMAMEAWAEVTLIAYALVFVGESLVLSPYAQHLAGRWWPLLLICLLACLSMVGALLAV